MEADNLPFLSHGLPSTDEQFTLFFKASDVGNLENFIVFEISHVHIENDVDTLLIIASEEAEIALRICNFQFLPEEEKYIENISDSTISKIFPVQC